jgi:hypothetical protein
MRARRTASALKSGLNFLARELLGGDGFAMR